jgi:hypothetical protein
MSPRRRKAAKPRRWLWLLGALVGATAAYFVVLRWRADSMLPIPGQPAERGVQHQIPQEEIHDSERDALGRVLRERTRGR